jgi:hypothetical protein
MAGYEVTHTGTFHLDSLGLRRWLLRLASGDIKGAIWSLFQGFGNLYSKLTNSGPMQYVVARPRVADSGYAEQSSSRPFREEVASPK